MKRTLVTSALPYANGHLHLGHCAGAYLPADIYVRYMRLRGEEILYVCGSDEHGVAITIAADKEKTTPQNIIDKYHFANKSAFEKFGMSFDIYSRTSIPEHHETARDFFADFQKKGYLIEKEEAQFYDEKAGMFLPDRYVEGICPNCGNDKARGDQCDNCGAYYNQLELKNPKSLVSGQTPIVKKTVHWYMKFNMFQEFLENYIESHSGDWKDNVLQQTRSWLKQGLAERAITRDLEWGVKIDGIPGIDKDKAKGKALYVWFDAVLGYITATKVYFKNQGNPEEWKNWWMNDSTRYIAFIGKDNIVFHTLIFPAMLHAKNDGFILPDNVPANEFLNLEGEKFSKSRNWSIDLKDFIDKFPETNYIDALRYTLAMNFPETKDSDFTWKDFQSRNNNELANIIGNFVNRTAQFIGNNFNGKVPELSEKHTGFTDEWNRIIKSRNFENYDKELINENELNLIKSLSEGIELIAANYERFRFRDAITETMNIARAANKYFNDEEPWKSNKTNPERCARSLYVCANLVHTLAVIFAPILPYTSEKMYGVCGEAPVTGMPQTNLNKADYFRMSVLLNLKQSAPFNKPELLFTKIEDDTVEKQIAMLGDKQNNKDATEKSESETNLISIDTFKQVQLRTGKIIEAENVPKSKKLIKLKVDTGADIRQIVAGIAEHYKPDDLIGKIIVVVVNLQPAKLMGIESNGMLLAANAPDGKLSIISPLDSNIGTGAEVR